MKSFYRQFNLAVLLCIGMLLVVQAGLAEAQKRNKERNTGVSSTNRDVTLENNNGDRSVTIDFNDVDIHVFIKFISELTGNNFIIDNKVKGKVTIVSPKKISVTEAYKVFESVLEVHGFAAVKAGEVIKIIPSTEARSKSIETKLKEESASSEDKVVTQLIPLTYANSDDIKRLFTPLVSKSSVILSYPQTNMLIVTDVYSNIIRLMAIIKAIDVTGMGQEISVVPLQYSDAGKLVKILDSVFASGQSKKKKSNTGKAFTFVAEERTNTIVMVASEVDTQRIKKLIDLLDKEIPRSKEKIHVVYLEHANAEELVTVLQAVPSKQPETKKGKKEAPVVSEKVMITADKATNSLIILAEKDDFLALQEIIKKLDIPRAMVYIESLIMEVNAEKDFELGTEWLGAGEVDIDGSNGGIAGGFGGSTDYGAIGDTLAGSAFLPGGLSLAAFGEMITIGDLTFPNLAAIVKAYKKDKDVHILSTPQVLTTDNEEAKIIIGKNVPYQTKSSADSGTETYSSYEYKDVGITLQITPQISKDRFVRLYIYMEKTALDDLSTTSADRPTTLKRTIETTTIVKDGNTIVIGGLIDDSFSKTDYGIPCLGDIPGLGILFSSENKASDKTNLFVFITPRVIENPSEAESLYLEKKEQIEELEKLEEGKIKMYDDKADDADG
jgi:general secretion pathway protein D